jgi:hypothetical protein
MMERWLRIGTFVFAAYLVWSLTGCAGSSEGGVVGSGISTVQGNVIDVELSVDTEGNGTGEELDPVLVRVEEAELETLTDQEGNFELSGDLAGSVTVSFSDPETRDTIGSVEVEVPAGSTVFLRDVEVRRDRQPSVVLPAPLQFNLLGTVVVLDCTSALIVVEDESGSRFPLRLRMTTQITNPTGGALTCEQIQIGNQIAVEEGVVDITNREIDAVKLVINPMRRQDEEPLEIRVRRRGVLLATDCDRRLLAFQDSELGDPVQVELRPETQLICEDQPQKECGCEDLAFGDLLVVEGIRRRDQRSRIIAARIVVTPTPQQVSVTLIGEIAQIDCAAQTLHADKLRLAGRPASDRSISVDLAEAMFRCRALQLEDCACEDFGPRDLIELVVEVVEPPGPAPATQVTLLATARTRLSARATMIDCLGRRLVVETGSGEQISVVLQSSTMIHLANGNRATCRQIGSGASLSVEGTIARRPLNGPVLIADRITIVRRL